jgi:hypothetical protein
MQTNTQIFDNTCVRKFQVTQVLYFGKKEVVNMYSNIVYTSCCPNEVVILGEEELYDKTYHISSSSNCLAPD